MIPVTKTFLPPQEEYRQYLSRAWEAGWITNRGELVKELEKKLKSVFRGSQYYCNNKRYTSFADRHQSPGPKGRNHYHSIFYVATTSSIVWENCTPVFVDIHPEYLAIDEEKIEAAITPRTSAILATHVFGNPCNVEAIGEIAKKYGLKVIYDAAHCSG